MTPAPNSLQTLIQQLQGGGGMVSQGFDPELDAVIRGILGQANTAQMEYGQGISRLGDVFQQEQTEIGKRQASTLDQLREKFGDQGLLQSGIYSKEQGDTLASFQGMIQQAAQRRALGESELGSGMAQFEQALRAQLGEAQGAASRRFTEAEQRRRQEAAQADSQQRMIQIQEAAQRAQQQAFQQMIQQQGEAQRIAQQQAQLAAQQAAQYAAQQQAQQDALMQLLQPNQAGQIAPQPAFTTTSSYQPWNYDPVNPDNAKIRRGQAF